MTSVSEKAKDLVKTSNGGSNGTGPQPKSNPVPPTMKGLKSVQVKDIFEKYKAQIAQAIPKHLTVDRVIQLATTLISRNPELAECSTESLLGAVLQTSILGFEPVQALGQCHLVPFNNKKTGKREVQFIIGYRGMVELTRRSNQLKTIYSQCVYSKDEFAYEFGLEPKLVHKPAMGDRGEFIYAYTVAHFNNGGYAFEVMSKYDVDKIRKRSQAGNSQYSPWNNDYEEMAKKTVIRRLWKMLPTSVEIKSGELSDEKSLQPDIFDKGEIDPNKVETTYEIVQDTETETDQETPQLTNELFLKE